jgi:hypothetical protein
VYEHERRAYAHAFEPGVRAAIGPEWIVIGAILSGVVIVALMGLPIRKLRRRLGQWHEEESRTEDADSASANELYEDMGHRHRDL